MTRLYQRLVIRLTPTDLLDAMHVVYEECAESCNDRMNGPLIHPIETIGNWLCRAYDLGWRPPKHQLYWGDTGIVDGVDDGKNPSWRHRNRCWCEDLD